MIAANIDFSLDQITASRATLKKWVDIEYDFFAEYLNQDGAITVGEHDALQYMVAGKQLSRLHSLKSMIEEAQVPEAQLLENAKEILQVRKGSEFLVSTDPRVSFATKLAAMSPEHVIGGWAQLLNIDLASNETANQFAGRHMMIAGDASIEIALDAQRVSLNRMLERQRIDEAAARDTAKRILAEVTGELKALRSPIALFVFGVASLVVIYFAWCGFGLLRGVAVETIFCSDQYPELCENYSWLIWLSRAAMFSFWAGIVVALLKIFTQLATDQWLRIQRSTERFAIIETIVKDRADKQTLFEFTPENKTKLIDFLFSSELKKEPQPPAAKNELGAKELLELLEKNMKLMKETLSRSDKTDKSDKKE